MTDTLTDVPPPHTPGPKTIFVTVRQTNGRRFNAYHAGCLLCSEVTQPFAASARMLLAEFGASVDDTVVFRLAGATGDHEGLVKRLGELGLVMRHAGSSTDALRGSVGGAAKLTVSEASGPPRLVPWKPRPVFPVAGLEPMRFAGAEAPS